MLVDRARHVGLLGDAESILERNERERRRRTRDEANRTVDRRRRHLRHGLSSGCGASGAEGAPQRTAFLLPCASGTCGGLTQYLERGTRLDVGAAPPAGDRRQ